MHILDELELADIQLRKQGLVHIIALFCLTVFLMLAEWALFAYVFRLIPETENFNLVEISSHQTYCEKTGDDEYTLYFYAAGRWRKKSECRQVYVRNIEAHYESLGKGDNWNNRKPNSIDLGIINDYHYLFFALIYGIAIALIFEPYLRRLQNKYEVLVLCEVYNTYSNPENFDSNIIETIEKFQHYKKIKPQTKEEKMFTKFLSKKLVSPASASAYEKRMYILTAKQKQRNELKEQKNIAKLNKERERLEKRQKADLSVENNTKDIVGQQGMAQKQEQDNINKYKKEKQKYIKKMLKLREKNKKLKIRNEHKAQIKRINEIMQTSMPVEVQTKVDMSKLTPQEKYELKKQIAEQKKRAKEKRRLVEKMRRESSFMK